MNSKLWIRKALSMCLVVATIATYSMVTLANSERIAGELILSSKNLGGDVPMVKVNNEAAQSGRSIFTSSTIVTPENTNAVINLGKTGQIELAPNTTLVLSFDDKVISGDLLAGRITVLNASEIVNIKVPNGVISRLNAGDTMSATGKAQDDDTVDGGGTGSWVLWALVLGGAAAGIVIAATTDNNRVSVGGGSTVISPTR